VVLVTEDAHAELGTGNVAKPRESKYGFFNKGLGFKATLVSHLQEKSIDH
jgi:hypothetical protein